MSVFLLSTIDHHYKSINLCVEVTAGLKGDTVPRMHGTKLLGDNLFFVIWPQTLELHYYQIWLLRQIIKDVHDTATTLISSGCYGCQLVATGV